MDDFRAGGEAVQPAVGHGDDHLPAHDLPLQMRVRIVLVRAVVPILIDRRVRRQPVNPHLVIVVQAALVVVDEHTRSNVHSIYKAQSPLYHIPLSYP